MTASALAADVTVVSDNQLYRGTVRNFRQGIADTADWSQLNSAGTELVLAGCRQNQARSKARRPARGELIDQYTLDQNVPETKGVLASGIILTRLVCENRNRASTRFGVLS